MNGRHLIATLLLLVGTASLAGVARLPVDRMRPRNLPLPAASIEPRDNLPFADPRLLAGGALDSVGQRYLAGTTYWDMQHTGSVGKMIAVDTLGYVHVVWRKSSDSLNEWRSVYYNFWDPATQNFVVCCSELGVPVNASPVAGYTTLAVTPDGWAIPAFHERLNTENTFFVSGAMDYQRRFGAFLSSQPARMIEAGEPIQTTSPKIALGPTGTVHLAAMEMPLSTDPGQWRRLYYARGTPIIMSGMGLGVEWDARENAGFTLLDTAMVLSQVVCASKTSERVAIVWAHSRDNLADSASRTQVNNDLYYTLSEDGGLNWGEKVNITRFLPPLATLPQIWDSTLQQWIGDTLTADQDTNRVYTDCDALFDADDHLHIAFTTQGYFAWEGTVSRYASDIWHWREQAPNDFSHLAGLRFRQLTDSTIESCWPPDETHTLGNWQRMTQRPSLSYDRLTGMLYCAYQWYDPQQVTTEGHAMADILLSVSTDNGYSWTDSVNVTGSGMALEAGCNPAPAGAALSERDMSLAEQVTYENGAGYLHLLYELDTGCGADISRHTLNRVYYRRIAIASLPARPVHDPQTRSLHIDGAEGVTPPHSGPLTESFRLFQNYPNPFNPVAFIAFELPRAQQVTLKVYNVRGQAVATLCDGATLTAGAHTLPFDGSALASGVYVYRLEAGGRSEARKMVLLK